MFGNKTYSHKDFLSAFFYDNHIYEYGSYRGFNSFNLSNGNVVEMIVDRNCNKVTWLLNDNKIADALIG